MAVTIFPTSPNSAITEANWQAVNNAANGKNPWRVTGFDLSVNAGLNLDVAAGTALVDGYYVSESATTTVALTDNTLNYIWLQADGTIYDNTSTTPTAATDLLLGAAGTSGGSITSIYPSYELAQGIGYEWEGRRTSFQMTSALGSSASLQQIASISLDPGLYHFRCILFARGTALSAGQTFSVEVDVGTATNWTIEGIMLCHFDEGPADDSAWITPGSAQNFTTENNNHPAPVHILGVLDLPEAGTLDISAATSANHTMDQSPLVVKKIR